jgi:hypothetical protein
VTVVIAPPLANHSRPPTSRFASGFTIGAPARVGGVIELILKLEGRIARGRVERLAQS